MEGIKKFFTNKIFLVTFITIIIVVMVAIFFVNSLNDNNKKNETETESTMNEETTTTKPNETETTTKENETGTEETTVNLREYYDNIIKGNIIENPNTVTDKVLFVTAIEGLEEVQGNIEDSFNSEELNESDYNDLNTTVSDLIALYNERIKEIEDATTTTVPPTTSTEIVTTQPSSSENATSSLRGNYQRSIDFYTIENSETVTDWGWFGSSIDGLTEVKGNIESSYKNKELSESDYNDLNATINELLELYTKKYDETLAAYIAQNPYSYRKDLPSNFVYNEDGSSNLKETTIQWQCDAEDQSEWEDNMFTFIFNINDEKLNNYMSIPGSGISFFHVEAFREVLCSHWDIRDYHIEVCKMTDYSTIAVFYVNDNFELVEGLHPLDQ